MAVGAGALLAVGAHVPVMRAWGFEPTAIGLTWVKLKSQRAGTLH